MSRLDCRELAALLARNCEPLFAELIPDAKPQGNELRGHGPDGAAWSIVTRGRKRGVFCNWGAPDQAGDCIELIHWALYPGERGRRESYQWALRRLGLTSTAGDAEAAERVRAARAEASEAAAWRTEQAAAERDRSMRRAKAIYLASRPWPSPELADYFQGRGLPVAELGQPMRALRFAPACPYSAERGALPAMVAPIIHPVTRKFQAVHCTFLEMRAGHWRNLADRPRRLTRGAKQGGIIPLLRGGTGKRLPPEGDTLLVGEGIENSLAAALCCPDAAELVDEPRVWAAVDIGNFASLELPAELWSVIFVHDRDDERFGRYREAVARAWLEEGRSVVHLKPPKGFKDYNDYVARLVLERVA